MPRQVKSKTKAEAHYVDLDVQSQASGEKFVAFDEEGLYACSRCATPIYLSTDKLTGNHKKPSFSRSIQGALIYSDDYSYGLPRLLTTCKQVRHDTLTFFVFSF